MRFLFISLSIMRPIWTNPCFEVYNLVKECTTMRNREDRNLKHANWVYEYWINIESLERDLGLKNNQRGWNMWKTLRREALYKQRFAMKPQILKPQWNECWVGKGWGHEEVSNLCRQSVVKKSRESCYISKSEIKEWVILKLTWRNSW